jgi:hypothetical protein
MLVEGAKVGALLQAAASVSSSFPLWGKETCNFVHNYAEDEIFGLCFRICHDRDDFLG